jgi:hypothetical protein
MFPFDKPKYAGITQDQRLVLDIAAHLGESFLRFIPRKIKNYPSHGLDHSLNIIEHTNNFVKSWGISLTKDERFLLYLAAWLHDIGCITVRKNHGIKSAQIFRKSETLCNYLNSLDHDDLINLEDIVKSHSSSVPITSICMKRGKVRTRLISSIFRLMDACEITNFKCPNAVYSEIKNTFKKRKGGVTVPDADAIEFWEGHMNIIDVVFAKPQIEVLVNDRKKCKTIISRLRTEIRSVKSTFEEYNVEVPKVVVKI